MSNLRIYKRHIFTMEELGKAIVEQIEANLADEGIQVVNFSWDIDLQDLLNTTLAGPRDALLAYTEGDKEKVRVTGWEGAFTLTLSKDTELDFLEIFANTCFHPSQISYDDQVYASMESIQLGGQCRIFQDDFKTMGVANLITPYNPYETHSLDLTPHEVEY